MAIPALLSKKLNGRPVMMRISREEETYIGRTRPGFQAWAKMGFKKDGRVTAIDAFIIERQRPVSRQGDNAQAANLATLLYQAPNARFRGISVATNTPPRVSQRAPGGLQSAILFEPLVEQGRQSSSASIRSRSARSTRRSTDRRSASIPAAQAARRARQGHELVREGSARSRRASCSTGRSANKRNGQRNGTKVRGVGVSTARSRPAPSASTGSSSSSPTASCTSTRASATSARISVIDTARVIAEVLDFPWENVVVVWGNTGHGVAWSSIQAGSQTTHAHTRANYAAGVLSEAKLAGTRRRRARRQSGRLSRRRQRRRRPRRPLDLGAGGERAIKRGGKFDGHELPGDINAMTKTSGTALAGTGLVGAARDTYPRDGQTYRFVAGFAEVEVDVETGVYHIVDYVAVADVGTVINPRSLGGQILGGAIQGMSHTISQKLVYDAHYGVAIGKRMYQNKPPTMLDIPIDARWEALNIPDPGNPVVGAKGIGEPGHRRRRLGGAVRARQRHRQRRHPGARPCSRSRS